MSRLVVIEKTHTRARHRDFARGSVAPPLVLTQFDAPTEEPPGPPITIKFVSRSRFGIGALFGTALGVCLPLLYVLIA